MSATMLALLVVAAQPWSLAGCLQAPDLCGFPLEQELVSALGDGCAQTFADSTVPHGVTRLRSYYDREQRLWFGARIEPVSDEWTPVVGFMVSSRRLSSKGCRGMQGWPRRPVLGIAPGMDVAAAHASFGEPGNRGCGWLRPGKQFSWESFHVGEATRVKIYHRRGRIVAIEYLDAL